ncbi:Uncharacterised protein [Salmonella enterica subsp. enterica]|uniref:Uncharacterized protein n=1 Tax=Salmonella enterica I TaxID=59201 RepID=A0A379X1B6_SALET|nr:Uncharacterised protein [Salmonella enterica subsp. enterica]
MVPPLPPCWFCTTVFLLHGAEGELHRFTGGDFTIVAAARGNHGDNQVGEGILEVLQRIAASLTHNQNGLRNVLAEAQYLNRFGLARSI